MIPTSPPDQLRIEIISAGAGSGKTYTLTGRMVHLLKQGVRARGIIATTFTQKAAAELQERVRASLLQAGLTEAANELGSALIGTVHSIGVRLLQRFAFEAGVSPLVEIIADGDQQRLFNESLAQVLSEARIETLNHLADRLGLNKKNDAEPYDWRREIRDLTDVARANNFTRDILELSKQRSWERFERLLPPARNTEPQQWNNQLIAHIEQTVAALDANDADSTKTTREAAEELRSLQNQLKWRGELYWHEWVRISKVKVGAKSRELFEDLRQFALSHDEHRQFRSDVRQFMDTVFEVASDALGEFEDYKKKRGLIDYTDMETYVSRLLRIQSVQAALREELDLLLVDEFQDTSPIQLDIFLQLSRLAKHSIWVGDPKQSIYGFRGAEPALMQAIIRATGGIRPENVLRQSWRSRPDIVYAVNAIFTKAFPGLPEEQIALEPAHPEPDPSLAGKALIHWHFRNEADDRKVPGAPWMEHCIANQIQVLLERGTPVFSKKRDQHRPAQPGDIAVLCRNNTGCAAMAEALHRAGLKAAIARAGLLETPEIKLALACLKYLLTPTDALSAAEILVLTGTQNLEQLVDHRLEHLERQRQGEDMGRWASEHEFMARLLALRPRTSDLSASEILNLALDELDLRRVAARLGNATQRLDNLDRLRRYALDYESACQRLHAAASLGGFLLWLNELARSGQDYQGSGESPDAVKVLTYHKSKGLEFPIAICQNLGQNLKEKIWGLNLVAEREEPDLDNILGHRWLRFWINPYGDQWRNTRLDETLQQSEEWAAASRQALDEEARLLYVGLTRARDYLVFPTNVRGTGWLNRVFNQGNAEATTLDPHSDETPFYWHNMPVYCQNEPLFMPRDFPEALHNEPPLSFHAPRAGHYHISRANLLIDHLHEWPEGVQLSTDEPQAFAPWLEFKGEYTAAIGKALVAFLLGDDPALPVEHRQALATHQLRVREVGEALNSALLLRQSEAFRQFVHNRLAPLHWHIRYPLEGWQGKRLLRLDADLLLENEKTVHALLFAGFAEGMKKWKTQVQNHTPAAYWLSRILPLAFPKKSLRYWLVFPVEGQVVELFLKN
ncbi:MAG: UvrD-helicase domain-containing protein [Saprospiraceae bacterium]|nr:UvrD-helicase domain-containing protein [Saprospiraceae bacterium]